MTGLLITSVYRACNFSNIGIKLLWVNFILLSQEQLSCKMAGTQTITRMGYRLNIWRVRWVLWLVFVELRHSRQNSRKNKIKYFASEAVTHWSIVFTWRSLNKFQGGPYYGIVLPFPLWKNVSPWFLQKAFAELFSSLSHYEDVQVDCSQVICWETIRNLIS